MISPETYWTPAHSAVLHLVGEPMSTSDPAFVHRVAVQCMAEFPDTTWGLIRMADGSANGKVLAVAVPDGRVFGFRIVPVPDGVPTSLWDDLRPQRFVPASAYEPDPVVPVVLVTDVLAHMRAAIEQQTAAVETLTRVIAAGFELKARAYGHNGTIAGTVTPKGS